MQNTSLYTLTWYSMVSTESKMIQNVKKSSLCGVKAPRVQGHNNEQYMILNITV